MKKISIFLILVMLITLSACSSKKQESGDNNPSSSISQTESGNSNTQNSALSQNSNSPSTKNPNYMGEISFSGVSVYKPKTKKESVEPKNEKYDLIERLPAEKVPNMSKTELVKLVSELYEIKLPESTKFESGSMKFTYEVLSKHSYDFRTFGTKINNLVAYYTKAEMENIVKQARQHKKLGQGTYAERTKFSNENKDVIRELYGDFSAKEYYQFDIFFDDYAYSNLPRCGLIFIMKVADNRYMAIFRGESTNYELYNGSLEVQADGSAIAKN